MSTLDLKRKRDIRRQRGQFLAVAITIGLGVMLFASSYDSYRNLSSSYNDTYDRLHFADITVVGANPSFVDTAATIEGVDRVEVRVEADIPMRIDGDTFLGRAVALPPDRQPEINKIDISEGSYLDPADDRAVVVESHTAGTFDIGVGGTLEILIGGSWIDARVNGVGVSAEYIWPARDNQEIFPPPKTFGVLFVSGKVFDSIPPESINDDVLITYADGASIADTDQRVRVAAFAAGAGAVITRADHPSNSTLLLDVNGFKSMSLMFPALFMLAAGMSAFVLLTRIVYSQRSQIGTMRASGMGRRMILRHYLSYGVRLGLMSGVSGVVFGIAGGYAITGIYTAQLGIPDTVRSFHWMTPLIGIGFGLAAGALGALAPARRAFRISPAEAMRDVVPMERGRPSLIEGIIPPLRSLPTRWLMVLRGIGRNRRRSLSTVLGVVLALTLVMVSWGMIDTVIVMIDRQFNEVMVEDADIILTGPVSQDVIDQVTAVPGVDAVEAVSTLEATVRDNGESFSTSLSGFRPDTVMHGFPGGLPPSGLVAGSGLAAQIGARIGDTVHIQLPTLGKGFDTRIVGFVDEPVGTYLYMDRSGLEGLTGAAALASPSVTTLKASFAPGADRETVITEIKKLGVVGITVDTRAFYDLLQSFLAFFYGFVGVMLVFGGAMAFALMFNTISVNVAERSVEFATMRANGLSHGAIARLVATENVLLTAIGLVPGLPIGYLAGVFFMSQFNVEAFTMKFSMKSWSIALSALAMLVVAVFSMIPAIRTLRRLEVGVIVRERAA